MSFITADICQNLRYIIVKKEKIRENTFNMYCLNIIEKIFNVYF